MPQGRLVKQPDQAFAEYSAGRPGRFYIRGPP